MSEASRRVEHKLSVLCVDDEPIILQSLRRQLRDLYPSCHIQIIQSSRAALNLIRERAESGNPYALLIVDHLMPEIKGDELLREVTQVSPLTYQVLLTGEIDSEAMGRIINHAKLFRFLAKPWTREELGLVVHSALESFRRDQELINQQEMNQQLARQLRQAQKIEMLSSLSSEVAHDFNNILNIIKLSADSLHSDLDEISHQMRGLANQNPVKNEYIDQSFSDSLSTLGDIEAACQQAQQLTQQLLRLSRDDDERYVGFELSAGVERCVELLRRLIPERVKLSVQNSEHSLIVRGDESSLHQAIMNLVINARDAISGSGEIRVITSTHTQAEDRHCSTGLLKTGEYAHIQVIDSGSGISDEDLNEIFEPFFSSKGDEGTGLGLTIVYQVIVSSLRGAIDVTSDAETVFHLYIPLDQE